MKKTTLKPPSSLIYENGRWFIHGPGTFTEIERPSEDELDRMWKAVRMVNNSQTLQATDLAFLRGVDLVSLQDSQQSQAYLGSEQADWEGFLEMYLKQKYFDYADDNTLETDRTQTLSRVRLEPPPSNLRRFPGAPTILLPQRH